MNFVLLAEVWSKVYLMSIAIAAGGNCQQTREQDYCLHHCLQGLPLYGLTEVSPEGACMPEHCLIQCNHWNFTEYRISVHEHISYPQVRSRVALLEWIALS